jgi:DNA-binding NarL/FixJ family response regulator
MQPNVGTAGARVVVADDSETIREAVRVVLSSSGALIVGEAGDGAAAVELADELAPDVVVLDLCMPVLDGLAALERIRAEHPETQVVVLSVHEDAESIRRSVRAGATEHVVKGTGAAELRAAVSRAAAIARRERAAATRAEISRRAGPCRP